MANDDRNLPSRLAPVITVVMLLLVGSLVPKGGVDPGDSMRLARNKKARAERERAAKQSPKAGLRLALGHEGKLRKPPELDVQFASNDGPDLSAYERLGSWIDIYDEWPWAHPSAAVAELHNRGVRTIFLQTSNWGAKQAIFKPGQTAKFLRSAHRKDMKVVSWHVPSFAEPKEDYRRSRAAIKFERGKHRFDSFGLDIESTVVGDIGRRNERLLKLSKRLRRMVGPDYTLGAITPDPVKALYWPDFPYRKVARFYDVFVPMGYFSFRTNGYKGVKKYTVASIRNIRRASGDPDVPIHLIGGIGGETKIPEVKAFVSAVRGSDVLGGSYYDMTVTSEQEWNHLETLADEPEPTPEPQPEETQVAVPEVRPTPLPPGDIVDDANENKKDKKSKGKHDKKKNKKNKKNEKSKSKHDKKKNKKSRDGKRRKKNS